MEDIIQKKSQSKRVRSLHLTALTYCICSLLASQALAWTPKPVEDDPLVRMPGTQPGQVTGLDSDKQCLSCHGGSIYEMENWKGSLMAQASRDPIFWAGLTVAAQDAIWALGTPNAPFFYYRAVFYWTTYIFLALLAN